MRKLIFLLLIVFFASHVYGKDKKDAKDLKIDSLTTANTLLKYQLDSVTRNYEAYVMVYVVVRDSIIKHDFDPSTTAVLIDSLKTSRNSAFAKVDAVTASLKDSISILLVDNKKLQATIDSLSVKKEVDITKMATDLKVLKELLDSNTLTQEEFDKQKAVIMKKYE